ncbi:hypothetical protein [Shewanella khirikhana]|uniref:Uncharacterized protein n=1 Tax=Shewanella khirikhana TaxID=1965282 RepID=A0ABN5TUP2_9GAMM|nr:hypothetical protein [Shewanella khirikhana]AZQ10255.1 hypothetical protein STH12_01119 [Shewanella khirikhana]
MNIKKIVVSVLFMASMLIPAFLALYGVTFSFIILVLDLVPDSTKVFITLLLALGGGLGLVASAHLYGRFLDSKTKKFSPIMLNSFLLIGFISLIISILFFLKVENSKPMLVLSMVPSIPMTLYLMYVNREHR